MANTTARRPIRDSRKRVMVRPLLEDDPVPSTSRSPPVPGGPPARADDAGATAPSRLAAAPGHGRLLRRLDELDAGVVGTAHERDPRPVRHLDRPLKDR